MHPFDQVIWSVDLGSGLRLLAAALLGGCVGLEREIQGHPAGLRTHMLVGVGAALFTIVALELGERLEAVNGAMAVDPLRALEAVTTGVAFIAAGVIIRSADRVRHLTTGAGLWLAGAVGLACGAGYLGLAGATTVVALVILVVLGWLERD